MARKLRPSRYSVRRGAAGRFFLQRLGCALQYRFASGGGEPGRRIQLLLGNAVSQKRTRYAGKSERRSGARFLLPDYLRVNGGAGRQGLSSRAVEAHEPDTVQRGSHDHRRDPGSGTIRWHLSCLGRAQQWLVGRRRNQILPGWRNGPLFVEQERRTI